MSAKKEKSATSGAAELRRSKRTLIWVAPGEEVKEKIRAAAGIVGQPMSKFMLEAGEEKADKILENFKKSS